MKTIFIYVIMLLTSLSLYSQIKKPVLKHEGVFGRATVGLGTKWTGSDPYPQFAQGTSFYHGEKFSVNGNLSLGYSITKNIQLYGKAGINMTPKDSNDFTYILPTYGIGINYYFLPINIFACFDVSGGQGNVKHNDETVSSQWGLFYNLGIGKEWAVSKKFGIGFMVYYMFGSLKNEPVNGQTTNFNPTSFGLNFSATIN